MRLFFAVAALALVACGQKQQQLECGPGTTDIDGTCRAAIAGCGPGTQLQGTECVPISNVSCGTGTHASNGFCLPDTNFTCGNGTVAQGNQCVAVDGTRYELRLVTDQVPSDGVSHLPVFAVGILPDGGPALDPVVLEVQPSFAATVTPSAFTLGAFGSNAALVPCNSFTSQACTGSATLSMALASAPNTPVVSTTFDLVTPNGVGTPAPCQVGGNVLYFDGDTNHYVYSGMQTVTQGAFSGTYSPMNDYVHIHLVPSNTSQGLWWDVEMTSGDTGPLQVGVYDNAQRYPFQSTGHPGFDISGDGRGCNMESGRFQIEQLDVDAGVMTGFTATFEQQCESLTPKLRGCVHWSP